jgi:glycosyltransferase involved in cell wall biosynthesis
MPFISVIISAYNGSKFIDEAVTSVVNQTFLDWELIIVDDNSKDDTPKIIKKWLSLDKRIKFYKNKKNYGPAFSRNIAVKYSTGTWLSILDVDDYYDINKLESQVELITKVKKKLVLVTTDSYVIKDNKKKLYKYPTISNTLKKNLFAQKKFPAHSSYLIKKKYFMKIGGYNTYMLPAEDHDLCIRLMNFGSFINIDKPLVYYRIHKKNFSKKKFIFSPNLYSIISGVGYYLKQNQILNVDRLSKTKRDLLFFKIVNEIKKIEIDKYFKWKDSFLINFKKKTIIEKYKYIFSYKIYSYFLFYIKINLNILNISHLIFKRILKKSFA